MMARFSKELVLTPPALERKSFVTTTTGAEVTMRELSVAERLDALRRFKITDEADPTQGLRSVLALVVLSLCNEDGSAMFPDDEVEAGVEGLGSHSSPEVEELMVFCQEMQGLAPDSVEEAVGN